MHAVVPKDLLIRGCDLYGNRRQQGPLRTGHERSWGPKPTPPCRPRCPGPHCQARSTIVVRVISRPWTPGIVVVHLRGRLPGKHDGATSKPSTTRSTARSLWATSPRPWVKAMPDDGRSRHEALPTTEWGRCPAHQKAAQRRPQVLNGRLPARPGSPQRPSPRLSLRPAPPAPSTALNLKGRSSPACPANT